MILVGGRPEEKWDERMRTWWEEGVGGGDEEGKGDSLDALVVRTAELIDSKPALMLKERSDTVLRDRALPPPMKGDSIACQKGS